MYFVNDSRDELCLNGDLLHSPALNFMLLDLSTAVDAMRQTKMLQETPDEEDQTRSSEDNTSRVSSKILVKITGKETYFCILLVILLTGLYPDNYVVLVSSTLFNRH